MSFHDPASDVGRLNRLASQHPVRVHRDTMAVLRLARRLSIASAGVFDITVAPDLVAGGHLPRPPHAPNPDTAARWHHVHLLADSHVRFARPLWIDLGGIAKGYAVDRALRAMRTKGAVQVAVNAGGDLRSAGREPVTVLFDVPRSIDRQARAHLLRSAALASSCATPDTTHRNGRTRVPLRRARFVSVQAPRCAWADGLTKLVLARGARARASLLRFRAKAWVCEAPGRWQCIGTRT